MRILFTGTNPMISYGLAPALQYCGVEVRAIDLVEGFQQNPYYLPNLINEFHPDFVFTAGGWGETYEILFPFLNQMGIPHIFWAFDDPLLFKTHALCFARVSKYIFTTAIECIRYYNRSGLNAHLLMFACLPSFHRRVEPNPKYAHDLIFVGNNYINFPSRLKGVNIILKPLINKGYDIKIYGNPWWLENTRPFSIDPLLYGAYLGYEDMRTAYSSAKIVLGLHSVDTSPTMMSMRTFEVLGCGAFYLTQWTPAIENIFKNHEHLVWSKSPEETVNLVNYYLAHPKERERVALNGQAEVYAKHSYIHRAKDLLGVLKTPTAKTRFRSLVYPVSKGHSHRYYEMSVKNVVIKCHQE